MWMGSPQDIRQVQIEMPRYVTMRLRVQGNHYAQLKAIKALRGVDHSEAIDAALTLYFAKLTDDKETLRASREHDIGGFDTPKPAYRAP